MSHQKQREYFTGSLWCMLYECIRRSILPEWLEWRDDQNRVFKCDTQSLMTAPTENQARAEPIFVGPDKKPHPKRQSDNFIGCCGQRWCFKAKLHVCWECVQSGCLSSATAILKQKLWAGQEFGEVGSQSQCPDVSYLGRRRIILLCVFYIVLHTFWEKPLMKLRMRRDGLNVLSLEMGRVYVLCGPAQLSSDVVSLTSVMHIVLERSNGGFPPWTQRNDGEGCSMGSKPTDSCVMRCRGLVSGFDEVFSRADGVNVSRRASTGEKRKARKGGEGTRRKAKKREDQEKKKKRRNHKFTFETRWLP